MHKEEIISNYIKENGLDSLFDKRLKQLSIELKISTTMIRRFIRSKYHTTYQSLKRDYFIRTYNTLKEKGVKDKEIAKILKIKNSNELHRLIKYFKSFRTMSGRKSQLKRDKIIGLACFSCGVYFKRPNFTPSLCKSCYHLQPVKVLPLSKYEEIEP